MKVPKKLFRDAFLETAWTSFSTYFIFPLMQLLLGENVVATLMDDDVIALFT